MVGKLIAENVLIWHTEQKSFKDKKTGGDIPWFSVMYLSDNASNTLSCDKEVFPQLAKGMTCDLVLDATYNNNVQKFKIVGVREKKK